MGAALAATAALAGCAGDSGTGDEVRGTTLTAYVSVPLHGPRAAEGRGIVDGAKLALADVGGEVGDLDVEAVYLDDSGGRASGWDPVATADNARQAAEDVTAIAYIGDLDSGATRTSLPITNQAEMAQISPGSTAVDLTRNPPLGPGPERLQPGDLQSFVRILPADDLQAHGAALEARRLGAREVLVLTDGSRFGRSIAEEFDEAAGELGLAVAGSPVRIPSRSLVLDSGVDGIYYGGTPDRAQRALAAAGPVRRAFIASDALLDPALLRSIGRFAADVHLTSSMLDPTQLPAAGQSFARDYREQFGKPPPPAAAYGYEAMALLLDAIRRAGDDGDRRSAVIDELFATRQRRSIVGTYSVEGTGDTTLDEISVYRVGDGVAVPGTSLRAPR